jgi:hypothetical protein
MVYHVIIPTIIMGYFTGSTKNTKHEVKNSVKYTLLSISTTLWALHKYSNNIEPINIKFRYLPILSSIFIGSIYCAGHQLGIAGKSYMEMYRTKNLIDKSELS